MRATSTSHLGSRNPPRLVNAVNNANNKQAPQLNIAKLLLAALQVRNSMPQPLVKPAAPFKLGPSLPSFAAGNVSNYGASKILRKPRKNATPLQLTSDLSVYSFAREEEH